VRRDRQEVVAQNDRLAQRLLRLLLVVDVGRRRDPPDDGAVRLAFRNRARDVPPVAAVGGALDADLTLEGGAAAQALVPVCARLGAVVGVKTLPE